MFFRIDISLLPEHSLSVLIRNLTEMSIKGSDTFWPGQTTHVQTPVQTSLHTSVNASDSTSDNMAESNDSTNMNTINTSKSSLSNTTNTTAYSSNTSSRSNSVNSSNTSNTKKCPLKRAVLALLSSLARMRKYDVIMKNDCVSVLITYASENLQNRWGS